jgi:hypothetical protein
LKIIQLPRERSGQYLEIVMDGKRALGYLE